MFQLFLMHLKSPKGTQRRRLYFYWDKSVCVCAQRCSEGSVGQREALKTASPRR